MRAAALGRRRTTIKGAHVLGAALALAITATFAYRMMSPVSVPVAVVAFGTVQEETLGPGTVQSRVVVAVSSRIAGTVERVLVDVGDEVQKGQLLMTLDRTELDGRARTAERAIESAREDVLLAQANLDRASSERQLARVDHERTRSLVAAGAIPTAELDHSASTTKTTQANERAARATVGAKRAVVARLVEEHHVAETILAYTEITAPMAGVLTRRSLEPGSTIAPGASGFQLVNADALWVAALVDQTLAGRIQLGQRAVIELRSGASASGHVARIALEADPVTRELEIDIAFDVRPPRFAIHEQADVTIFGPSAAGRVVPVESLTGSDDRRAVYVVRDGKARRRNIRLSVVGASHAVVVDGVEVGEQVILTPNAIRDGQRVAPQRSE